jgi:uncharacterized protein GlcG (DUF336 family)
MAKKPSSLVQKTSLTLEAAKQIATAAHTEAKANGWNVVIAVVDDGGNLIYLERMDEAQFGSVQVAQDKARAAIAFKRPTRKWEDVLAGGRTAVLSIPGVMPLEGGEPLIHDGRIIGGIGVSGVTSAQDGQIARAGAAVLG